MPYVNAKKPQVADAAISGGKGSGKNKKKHRKKDEKMLDKMPFLLYYIRVVRRNLNMLL